MLLLCRAGGRIHTDSFGQGRVTLGANVIEGDSLGNSFYVLATQIGLVPKQLEAKDR